MCRPPQDKLACWQFAVTVAMASMTKRSEFGRKVAVQFGVGYSVSPTVVKDMGKHAGFVPIEGLFHCDSK